MKNKQIQDLIVSAYSYKKNLRFFAFTSLLAMLLSTCQKWDLERIDFLKLKIEEVQLLSPTAVSLTIRLEGLEVGEVQNHGLLWSTSDSLPKLTASEREIIQLGAKENNGLFTAQIEGINPNQKYWIRAYAELAEEVVYSETKSLFTPVELQVDANHLEVIRGTANALGIASITGLVDGATIGAYGHCWTNENRWPLISDNRTVFGESTSDIPTFESKITNLEAFEKYYIRPYATAGGEVFYGEVDSLAKANAWQIRVDGPWWEVHQSSYYSIKGLGYLLIIPPWSNGKDNFWHYDPVENNWFKNRDCPAPTRSWPFSAQTATKAYVGLGETEQGDRYRDIWEYDTQTDIWRFKADFPEPGRSFTTGFTINGTIYMAFGKSDMGDHNDIWRFDPDEGIAGTWQHVLDCDCTPRSDAHAFVLDGKAYLLGGSSAQIVVFDPENSTHPCYVQSSNQALERYRPVAIAHDGLGYYGGGITGAAETKNDFWEYDPHYEGNGFDGAGNPMGRWSKLANLTDLPITSGREGAAAFSIQDRLFVGFGYHNHHSNFDFWEYFPDEK